MQDGQPVGGVVIKADGERGDLDLLFVSPKCTAKESAMQLGALWNACIRKGRFGKLSRRISRNGISISTSIGVAFILWSSSIVIILIRMIRIRQSG